MFDADEPPFHTNEIGTQFWLDKSLTKYARCSLLPGVHVLIAKTTDGNMQRLLIDSNSNDVLYECQSYEAMAVHIDMLRVVKDVVPMASEAVELSV